MTSAVFSSLHLIALALGLPGVFLRGRALKGALDDGGFRRLFVADAIWGVAAGLWIATGLMRAFGGLEKGADFYLSSPLFWAKMGLLLAILLLEVWPMATFIRWRIARRRNAAVDTRSARQLYAVNQVQLVLVIVMVFAASGMARGVGL